MTRSIEYRLRTVKNTIVHSTPKWLIIIILRKKKKKPQMYYIHGVVLRINNVIALNNSIQKLQSNLHRNNKNVTIPINPKHAKKSS